MASTKELVGELMEVEQQISMADQESLEHDKLLKERLTLQREVKAKIQNVDYFMLELNKKEYLLDAEVEALKDEINRLKGRKNSLQRCKDFFNKQLLPAVIEEIGNEDGVYETDTARYKLYESFGPVAINPDKIKDEFKKVEILEKLDKVKARKAAIEAYNSNSEMPKGIDIGKVKRVKRT